MIGFLVAIIVGLIMSVGYTIIRAVIDMATTVRGPQTYDFVVACLCPVFTVLVWLLA